jgi:small-conductance mechanosensitive channel
MAAVPASVKAALPSVALMMMHGALNFVVAIAVLCFGWTTAAWLSRRIRGFLSHSARVDATLKPLLASTTRYVVLAVTLVVVLGQFGVQTTSLIALLGAAGLAIGLALQGTLSNVASGVMLLVLRPFRVSEKITSGQVVGTVQEIGLFQTVLITDDGFLVSVPNSLLFANTILNNSRRPFERLTITIDIDYRAHVEGALDVIRRIIGEEQNVLTRPSPQVLVVSAVGGAISIQVRAWIKNGEASVVQSALLTRLRPALLEHEILPALPHLFVEKSAGNPPSGSQLITRNSPATRERASS